MTNPSHETKIVGDAVNALTDLEQALTSSGDDLDTLSRGIVSKADRALQALDQVLTEGSMPGKELKGRGSILNVMNTLSSMVDNPAVQTALAATGCELSDIFRRVHKKLLAKKDPKKVEETLFGRLDKE